MFVNILPVPAKRFFSILFATSFHIILLAKLNGCLCLCFVPVRSTRPTSHVNGLTFQLRNLIVAFFLECGTVSKPVRSVVLFLRLTRTLTVVNLTSRLTMGVGRIFSMGNIGGILQSFSKGGQSGEICFFPLKNKKTTFFAEISMSSLPSAVHATNYRTS